MPASDDQLTQWAESCLHANHLNTLIQREIAAGIWTERESCLSVPATEHGRFSMRWSRLGARSLKATRNGAKIRDAARACISRAHLTMRWSEPPPAARLRPLWLEPLHCDRRALSAAVAHLILVRLHKEIRVRLNMRPITFFLFLLIGCAGIHGNVMSEATNAPAVTEAYPTKPVRLIEPFGVGGGPDLLARALAQQLSELWGQPVTVENVPGAGATAGPAQVA